MRGAASWGTDRCRALFSGVLTLCLLGSCGYQLRACAGGRELRRHTRAIERARRSLWGKAVAKGRPIALLGVLISLKQIPGWAAMYHTGRPGITGFESHMALGPLAALFMQIALNARQNIIRTETSNEAESTNATKGVPECGIVTFR